MRSHKLWSALAIVDVGTVVFALILCDCAAATTLAQLSVEQMTAAAATIARGRCIANESRWEKGEIWTISTIEIEEVWKGAAPERISVRLIGGHSGHFISTVAGVPRFHPGEEVILFLEPGREGEFTVTGWVQGTFRIGRDPASGAERVTQDSAGLGGFDPAAHEIQDGGIHGLLIEQLRSRVRAALDRSGRDR
jgi:hypothetical protein